MKINKKQQVPCLLAIVTLLMLLSGMVMANTLETGRFVLAGYGDVSYLETSDLAGEGVNSNVQARFVPIFLFQLSEKIHIEAELEFALDETGATEVEMEYADLHYFLNDKTIITAGKFLLSFGQFGPNLHPSWINKLPTPPGIYGHGGNGALTPLMPVLSDTGLDIRNVFKLGSAKLFTDFYVVSGPRQETGDEELTALKTGGHGDDFPAVELESALGDNNAQMAVGGRIALAFLPQWETGISFYRGAYDPAAQLDFQATAIDLNWIGAYSSLRGEKILTRTDFVDENDGERDVFKRDGWYLQGTWQLRQLGKQLLNPVELVLRRSAIEGAAGGKRWTYGFNYWLESSAALKVAFEDTQLDDGDKDSRWLLQLAFGF
jgi:hypothetical protein